MPSVDMTTNAQPVTTDTVINLSKSDKPGYRCYQPQTNPQEPQPELPALKVFFARNFAKIINNDIAWPFLEPVNEETAMAPNYYDVVKKPMDFNTLRKRYRNRWYTNLGQFLKDYRQIYANCYRFNDSRTEVHGMARELEQFSEPFVAPIEDAWREENEKSKAPAQNNNKKPQETKTSPRKEIQPTKVTKSKAHQKNEVITSTSKTTLSDASKLIDKAEKAKSPKKQTETASSSSESTISKKRDRQNSSPSKRLPKVSKYDSTPSNNNNNKTVVNLEISDTKDAHLSDSNPVIEIIKSELENSSNQMKEIFFDPHVMQALRPISSLSPQIMMDCNNILNELKSKDYSHVIWPFINHPSNVKYPDLAFVEASLNNGKYSSVEAFATAVRHVFMHILTTYDNDSQINNMAKHSLDIFDHIYSKYLNRNLSLIKSRTNALSSSNLKLDEVYKLLMDDCEIQKNIGMKDRKLLQMEKRHSEVERQFNIFRSQSSQTTDKLRKRISYLKSKQQSDLVYINEKFQTAVKSAAQIAGTGSFNGQILPQTAPLKSKNVKNKLNKYYQSKTIAPIKERDELELTSRSIMLAGNSKSDDEEETERVLTHDERRKLSYDIDRLSQKMLAQLIEKITIWENLDPTQVSEFVIDYDNMKPVTLRKVSDFVSLCVKRLPRQKQIQGIPVTDPHHPNYSSQIIKTEETVQDNTNSMMMDQELSASSDGEQLQIEENQGNLNIETQSPSDSQKATQNNNNSTMMTNFIHIKKNLDNNQLVSALHSLEKDKSNSPKIQTANDMLSSQNNAFVHLIPGNHSIPIGSPIPPAEVAPTTPNKSAWSNFGENLKENTNSEAKALESVVGGDYNFQAAPERKSDNDSPNPDTLQIVTSPNDPNSLTNPLNQAISSPASSSSGHNKELLKAEAKKRRAANIDKNETIEQRELITSYEEGAMLR